jgi:hypothetical protein
MTEFIKELKKLVAELKLETVFSKLNQLFTVANPELETALIITEAKWNNLKKRQLYNDISHDQFSVNHAIILNNLLDLINQVQQNINKYLAYISENNTVNAENQKDIILFLGANPGKFNNIDVLREVEQISNKLSSFKKRDWFEFKVQLDVQPSDFLRAALKYGKEPRFIHFGGSATINDSEFGTGLILAGENPKVVKVLKTEDMSAIFKNFTEVECVFLNACNTMPFGIEISKSVSFVIAMNQYTTDKFAIDFATYFYESIGAGKSIKYSYDYSITMLQTSNLYKEEQIKTPQLLISGQEYSFEWYHKSYDEWHEFVKPN